MRDHIIIATDLLPDLTPGPVHYFAGYLDQGCNFEPIWTPNPRSACWIDDAEVTVELALLAGICPGTLLKSWSSNAVGSKKAS